MKLACEVIYDGLLITAAVYLIVNGHPWFALLLILFIVQPK